MIRKIKVRRYFCDIGWGWYRIYVKVLASSGEAKGGIDGTVDAINSESFRPGSSISISALNH